MIALKISDHSAASQHVSELESIGWIKKVKEGSRETCYITDKAIKDCKSINKFMLKQETRMNPISLTGIHIASSLLFR